MILKYIATQMRILRRVFKNEEVPAIMFPNPPTLG